MFPALTELLLAANLTMASPAAPVDTAANVQAPRPNVEVAATDELVTSMFEDGGPIASDFCCTPDSCQCYGSCK